MVQPSPPPIPPPSPKTRTGALRLADIPPDLLARLNRGELETRTLAEGLAVDPHALLRAVFPDIGNAALAAMVASRSEGVVARWRRAGEILHLRLGAGALDRCLGHPSDISLRGWACAVILTMPDLTLAARLGSLRILADDRHAGVREWAWLAVRPHLTADVRNGIRLLVPWTGARSEFLRRFASEATRPRGVWCPHIEALKLEPELGLPLLEPLRADPARYVQNSVGNWLNDASKSRPEWVRTLAVRWLDEAPGPATERITTRALRTASRPRSLARS